MQDRSKDQAAIAALEARFPAFMCWVDRFPDGEAQWFAVNHDNAADLLMADDPVTLGQAIQDAVSPPPGIVATDAGGWISGPAFPNVRTVPVLTAAVAASIARNHPHRRRWLPAALLRRLGEAGR